MNMSSLPAILFIAVLSTLPARADAGQESELRHAPEQVWKNSQPRFKHDAAVLEPAGETNAKPKEKAGAVQTTEGTFIRIDEGDYLHWVMKTTQGKEMSFFVLKPDAGLEKVLAAPGPFAGKKCRVQWKSSTENIPEAGGMMKLEQILSVEWLVKK